VVVRELGEDTCENFAGDSAAQLAGLRSETMLSGSNEPFEDGVVERVERPSVLGMDGPEASEVSGESRRLDVRCLNGNPELDGGTVSGKDAAVCTGKAPLPCELAEGGNMPVILSSGRRAESVPQKLCDSWMEMRVGLEPLR
jgi:hypothetical protein